MPIWPTHQKHIYENMWIISSAPTSDYEHAPARGLFVYKRYFLTKRHDSKAAEHLYDKVSLDYTAELSLTWLRRTLVCK